MRVSIGLEVTAFRFTYEPVQGRIALYIAVRFLTRTYWLQRWSEKFGGGTPRIIARSRDGLMVWNIGTHNG